MESEKPVQGRFTSHNIKETIKIKVRFGGNAGSQMGGRRTHISLYRGE
jgi:hypothetical protein